MAAYVYVRFSDPRQEKGASRQRQLEDCHRLCARKDWDVAEVIEDLGRSAWTGVHLSSGNLGKFAERVRAGEIPAGSVLVVEKLDRLSRQEHRKTLRWLEDLCELGLRIATVAGDRVYDDASLRDNPMEVFEILFGAHLAYRESQQKSERVRDQIGRNMQKARDTGRVISMKAPGWLKAREDRTGFDMIPQRVAVVREMYDMAADGKGPRLIAKLLNERGVPAWGRWRKPTSTPTWELSYVRLILRQPSVEGDYVPGFSNTKASRTKFTDRIVGYYPRIVDADLVARARRALDSRKLIGGKNAPRVGSGGRHIRNVANLFAGMVICEECHNRMHLRTNGQQPPTRHWQCNFASRRRGCSQTTMFRYAPFEMAALDEVLHLALDDRYFSAAADRTGLLVVQLAELEKGLQDREAQSSRLVQVLARTDDAPEIESALDDLRRERRVLEEQCARVGEALQLARGAVSPSEHLKRVREVRGALHDADLEVRVAARTRVHGALRELGCMVVCGIFKGERMITLMLGDGSFIRTFNNLGAVTGIFDPVRKFTEKYPDKTPEEIANLTAKTIRWVFGEILAAVGEPAIDEGMETNPALIQTLATHARREKAN